MKYVDSIVAELDKLAEVRKVWDKGLMNPGGPHRRLAGAVSPISIGEDECALLGKLIETFRPNNCFIVGNAFGFSSAYIALAMRDHGGEHVVTLDAETEGDGASNATVARALTRSLGLDLLHNKKGFSPRDIPGAVESEKYDMIFIDGCHGHPAVSEDLHGAIPYAHDETIFVFHDFWFPGVRHGVQAAVGAGYHCLWVPTSCEMVVATRSESRFEQLKSLFPEGDSDPDSHFSMPRYAFKWWLRSMPVYWAVFSERLGGRSAVRALPQGDGQQGPQAK